MGDLVPGHRDHFLSCLCTVPGAAGSWAGLGTPSATMMQTNVWSQLLWLGRGLGGVSAVAVGPL